MRDGEAAPRPRRARSRWSASTKLPKMNNSERGKFYRKKYKDYEQQLERDVLALRARVRELALITELSRQLRDDLRVLDAGAAAAAVLERLDVLKASADARDAPPVEWVGRAHRGLFAQGYHHTHDYHTLGNHTYGNHTHGNQDVQGSRGSQDEGGDLASTTTATTTTTTTRFELESLQAVGCADAPVVVVTGWLRVVRQSPSSSSGGRATVRNPGGEEELAAYPSTYQLLFSADCTQHEVLEDVGVAVGPPLRVSSARAASVTRQDVTRVTASMASASLAPGRLPSVRQLLRVAAQHRDGYSSAGTIESDSSCDSLGGLGRLGKRRRAMTMDFILSDLGRA